MASPVPISPLSAAFLLTSWIAAHGCEPRKSDCSPDNGLLYWRTFLKKLPGDSFSAVISYARDLVSSAPKPRMQHCLGSDCVAVFCFNGYHFCPACRADLGHDDMDGVNGNGRYLRAHDRDAAERGLDLTTMTVRELREYGMDDLLLDADDVPFEVVHGYDDMIASQMNAWKRLSRKRRFVGGG